MQQPPVKWANQAMLIRGSATGLLGPASVLPGPCLDMGGAQGSSGASTTGLHGTASNLPVPSLNLKGSCRSRELSKAEPSSRVPT